MSVCSHGHCRTTTTYLQWQQVHIDFSKWFEAHPLPDQTAETVGRTFATKFITRHGTPQQLLTDRGSNFMSQLFQEVCKKLEIEKLQTTPYHPAENGMNDREDILYFYTEESQRDWDEWIPFATMAYNNLTHIVTNESPYFLIHGRDVELPFDDGIQVTPTRYNLSENYAEELMVRLHSAFHDVAEHLRRATDKIPHS